MKRSAARTRRNLDIMRVWERRAHGGSLAPTGTGFNEENSLVKRRRPQRSDRPGFNPRPLLQVYLRNCTILARSAGSLNASALL